MSQIIQNLTELRSLKSYKRIVSNFYDFFTNKDTLTIDQIKEILDYGGYQLKGTPFFPENKLDDNPVREAFMMAENHLNKEHDISLIDQFDIEYKQKFMRMINQIISIQPILINYPTQLLIEFQDNIDWLIQEKSYFCIKELQPIIKKRIEMLYPDCLESNSKYRKFYNGSIGEIFWRMIAVGIDIPISFIELLVDSGTDSSMDRSFIEPISDYFKSKIIFQFCSDSRNKYIEDYCKKLDNINPGIKLKISMQY